MNIIGVDVSKYNIGWNPDKATKHIDFVVQRASWAGYADEKFLALNEQVSKIPIRGAYHYYSSALPWTKQVAVFLKTTMGKGFTFYALDYERSYNNLNKRTIAEASEFVKFVKAQTGKPCLFYFSPSIYIEFIRPFGYTNWLNKQDIWVAQYPKTLTQTPPTQQPSMSKEITHWDFWQYGGGDVNFTAGRHAGADYGGGLVGIDLNYFGGTPQQLVERFGS